MGVILSFIIAVVVAAVVLLIVSRFNLGLSVSGFGAAAISAIVIAIVGAVVLWLLGLLGISISLGGGFFNALIFLIVAAVVLLLAARFVPGLTVKGFVGAIVAAIAIGVVYYLLVWLLGLFGIAI